MSVKIAAPARNAMKTVFRHVINLVFSQDPRRIRQCMLPGRSQLIWTSEHVGRKIALRLFERAETRFFEESIKPGDICLDIGANVGYYTQLFSVLNGGAPVIAVEPIKRNAALIRFNAAINEFDNICVFECAVGEESEGVVEFSVCGDSAFSSRRIGGDRPVTSNPLGKKEATVVVPSITIDRLIEEEGVARVDLLKMDIEGGEYRALVGMQRLLSDSQQRPRLMLIELDSSHLGYFGNTIEQVCEYLGRFGYCPHYVEDGSLRRYMPEHRDVHSNVVFIQDQIA